MEHTDIKCRQIRRKDVARVIELMRKLAEFEGYAADFHVTVDDLIEFAFAKNPPFRVFVACIEDDMILGMAVTYLQPWTYHRSPTVILKELFVASGFRSNGIGAALFKAITAYAAAIQAFDLKWTVLAENTGAQEFYRQLGGRPETKWINWKLRISV